METGRQPGTLRGIDKKDAYFDPQNEISNKQQSPMEGEQPLADQLYAVHPEEAISYTLQNDELNITFNQGQDWITVPVIKEAIDC